MRRRFKLLSVVHWRRHPTSKIESGSAPARNRLSKGRTRVERNREFTMSSASANESQPRIATRAAPRHSSSTQTRDHYDFL